MIFHVTIFVWTTYQTAARRIGVHAGRLSGWYLFRPTLSRIENGERLPSKQHSEMLLQRLGYSDSIIINYVDEKTLKLHESKYSIRHEVMCGKLKQARSLIEQFVSMASFIALVALS